MKFVLFYFAELRHSQAKHQQLDVYGKKPKLEHNFNIVKVGDIA